MERYFLSNVTVPSLYSVLMVELSGSGVLQLSFLSCSAVNKSMYRCPVMGSSPEPVDDSREEAKTMASAFLEANPAP